MKGMISSAQKDGVSLAQGGPRRDWGRLLPKCQRPETDALQNALKTPADSDVIGLSMG